MKTTGTANQLVNGVNQLVSEEVVEISMVEYELCSRLVRTFIKQAPIGFTKPVHDVSSYPNCFDVHELLDSQ